MPDHRNLFFLQHVVALFPLVLPSPQLRHRLLRLCVGLTSSDDSGQTHSPTFFFEARGSWPCVPLCSATIYWYLVPDAPTDPEHQVVEDGYQPGRHVEDGQKELYEYD